MLATDGESCFGQETVFFRERLAVKKTIGMALLSLFILTSCTKTPLQNEYLPKGTNLTNADWHHLDKMYSDMALAVVLKNWQVPQGSTSPLRGYNIGCVLVDNQGNLIRWARNSNKITQNGTMHGEVRCIQGYINNKKCYVLPEGTTLYASLEPCAQCAGMMTLSKLDRTVYCQKDPVYGGAIERLYETVTNRKPHVYPIAVQPVESQSPCFVSLNASFASNPHRGYLTDYLYSQDAKKIFEKAKNRFLTPDTIGWSKRVLSLHKNAVKFFKNVKLKNEQPYVTNYYVPLPAMR